MDITTLRTLGDLAREQRHPRTTAAKAIPAWTWFGLNVFMSVFVTYLVMS